MWEKLKIISSNAWVFVLPFLRQMMTNMGPVLMEAAVIAVKSATGSNGLEKRQAAFAMITTALKNQGVSASESLINAAIEMAIIKSK